MLRIAELSRAASRSNLAKADRATNLAKQVLPRSRRSAAPVVLSRLLRCGSREQHRRASRITPAKAHRGAATLCATSCSSAL